MLSSPQNILTQNLHNFLYKEKKTVLQSLYDKIQHLIRMFRLAYNFAPVVIIYILAWLCDLQSNEKVPLNIKSKLRRKTTSRT